MFWDMSDSEQPAAATWRVPFLDFTRVGTQVVLVIPPGAQLFGQPKIGVEHPGCAQLADLSCELDAFYCTMCRWNGRCSGAWVEGQIRAASYR
jgi:hypothetical protein